MNAGHSISLVRVASRFVLMKRNMGGRRKEASIAPSFCSTRIRSVTLKRVPWISPKRNATASRLALSMPITRNTVIRVLSPISI